MTEYKEEIKSLEEAFHVGKITLQEEAFFISDDLYRKIRKNIDFY